MALNQPTLLLASTSPRRKQLLELAGWDFQVCPTDIDETRLPGEDPRDYVLRLAEAKARSAAGSLNLVGNAAGWVVLASDTAVVDPSSQSGGQPELLGKPGSPQEAERMLLRLRGRSHLVMTALAALSPADGMLNTAVSVSEVTMREYSLAEIHAYVESGDPLDKAGAYAIQHPGFHPVERVSGCYAGVMGLPMCLLPKILLPFQLAIPEGQTQLNTFCGLDGQPQTHGCLVARWLKE